MKKTVAAIVPAYNEEERIADVLKTLIKCELLTEIIVVDDGSTDNTLKIAQKFPTIKLLRNKKNIGKSQAMEKGIKACKSDIIFFCDADLEELTTSIVEEIIRPVLSDKYDMFIGVRNNISQKIVKSVALLSGERAFKKHIWNELPDYYKHRQRIEVGLNNYLKNKNKRIGYKLFPYYNTLKESKYGIFKGLWLRSRMYYEFFIAFILSRTIEKF